jgi:hypothetical protein
MMTLTNVGFAEKNRVLGPEIVQFDAFIKKNVHFDH